MKPLPAVLLGTAVGLASLVVPAGAAGAESPSLQGWWTSANLGGTSPAPDVPAKGLLVEGGVSSSSGAGDTGAAAYAALAYQVPSGQAPGKLTLDVAANSATTPDTTLELCPLDKTTFTPQQGGAMSGAPAYKCTKHVTAAPSSNGSSYQFDVSSLVSDGSLAVAILPTMPTDRVVLNQPGDQSLDLPGSSSGGSTSSDTTTTTAPATGGSAGSSSGSGASDSAASVSGNGSSSSGVGVATSPSPGDAGTSSPSASSGASPDLSSTPSPSSSATPAAGSTGPGSAAPAASGPAASNQSSAAAGSNPSIGSGASEQLATASGGSGGANPAAVGAIIGAVVIGGLLWTAAGRAASRRVDEEDGPPT